METLINIFKHRKFFLEEASALWILAQTKVIQLVIQFFNKSILIFIDEHTESNLIHYGTVFDV